MSRYHQEASQAPESPVAVNLEWKAAPQDGKPGFRYWDKESESRLNVKPPFKFIFLDEWCGVKGYSKSLNARVYSSEWKARESKTTPIFVGAMVDGNPREIARGPYSAIKGQIPNGAKFHRVVYALTPWKGALGIVRIWMGGSISQMWDTFTEQNPKVLAPGTAIVWNGELHTEEGHMMNWSVPILTFCECQPETESKAKEADGQLREFFKKRAEYYAERDGGAETKQTAQVDPQLLPPSASQPNEPMTVDEIAEDDIPF